MSNQAVPFRHLMRMTDQIGLLEHAEGIVPGTSTATASTMWPAAWWWCAGSRRRQRN